MYKNIIFDADGTLLDTLDGIHAGFNYAFKSLGEPLVTKEQVKPFLGPSLMDTFINKFGFSEEKAKRCVLAYREFYWDKGYRMCEFYPGIAKLLDLLKAEGKILSVATNKPQEFIDIILKNKGYYGHFAAVAGAGMTDGGTDKTPIVKRAILDKSAVMVGDRYIDIEAAKNARIDSIGVMWGSAQDNEFNLYKATHIANNTDELYKIING